MLVVETQYTVLCMTQYLSFTKYDIGVFKCIIHHYSPLRNYRIGLTLTSGKSKGNHFTFCHILTLV
jgi:hypothetical protein